MNSDLTSFIFGAIGCSIPVGTVLWRIISLKLDSEVRLMQHSLEKKDLQIESLQNIQILSQKGLEEKFEHYSTRVKGEIADLAKHIRQVDHFLAKTTAYEPRE